MTSSVSSQVKCHKPDLEDSPDKLSCLLNKSADMCNHCNKECTSNDEAIQCDLCSAWVHASCEDLSHEQYALLCQLASSANVVYYCNFLFLNPGLMDCPCHHPQHWVLNTGQLESPVNCLRT